jgi:F0F1-type ATP synthase membrane subunit b/b'
MKNEYEEYIEKAKKSIDELEEKIEHKSEEFSDEANAFWKDLKHYFEKVKVKLQIAADEAELKSQLGMMEAREVLENVRDSAEGFLATLSRDASKEIDLAELKAHLAKMEAEDKWEETQKELTRLYGESKVEVERLAKKAGKEINEIMLKLSQVV